MWQPDPSWTPLGGGGGPASAGLWRTERQGRAAIVKRLRRPEPGDPDGLSRPGHAGYWRREVELALDPTPATTAVLAPPEYLAVEEDEDGATVIAAEIPGPPPTSLEVARALGAFAATATGPAPVWLARDTLGDRLAIAEERDGWPTLRRTTVADVSEHLWERRRHWLSRIAEGPQGRAHGDATPANLLGRHHPPGEPGPLLAADWQAFGTAPVGADLGYFALSAVEDYDVLLDAYLDGVGSVRGDVAEEDVRLAARVVTVYTVLSRAEWALARAAAGEGPLAGKFHHPAVAPHLRALQRQAERVEALL